jgi:S1-C subfamily serine protease
VASADGLVVFASRALDPAAEAFALLGVTARAELLSVAVVGRDGRAREAEWLGRSPELGLSFVRVRATGLAGLKPAALDAPAPALGEPLLVLGLAPAPLGGKPRVEPARVACVGESVLLLSPQLPGSEGGLVLGPDGAPVGILAPPELPTAVEGDLLRVDALGQARAGLVVPGARIKPLLAKPPAEAPAQGPEQRRGRAWLGARHEVVTPELAQAKQLKIDWGVVLVEVWDGPAKKAGLQAGDVLVQLDGEPLELDPGEGFGDLIQGYAPGQRLELKALRGEKPLTVTLELEAGPTRAEDADRATVGEVGLLLRDLTFFDRRDLGLDDQLPGAVVVEIEPDGAASRAGLRPGDLLLQIDGQPLGGLVDARQRLAAAGTHALSVRRRNETLTLKVRR